MADPSTGVTPNFSLVLVSSLLNKLPLTVLDKNQFHWAKVKMSARLVPFGSSERGGGRAAAGVALPCLFQLLVATSIPWLWPSSIPEAYQSHLCLSAHHLLLCLWPSCNPLIRTLWSLWAHQDNLGQSPHLKIFNLITAAKWVPFAF